MNCLQNRVSVERTERTTGGVVNNRDAVLDPVSWVQAELTRDEFARVRIGVVLVEAQLYSIAAGHLETLISAIRQVVAADICHSGSVHRYVVVLYVLGINRAWVHLLETRQLGNYNCNIRPGQREVVCGRSESGCTFLKRNGGLQRSDNNTTSCTPWLLGRRHPLGFELQ